MTAAPRLRLPSWPICRSSQLPGHQESRRRCWTSPDTSQCLRRPNCALYRLRGAQVNLKASLRALAYAGARSGLRGAQLPNSSSSRQWRTRHRLHSVVVDTTNQPKRNARGDVRIPSLGGRPQLHRSKLSGHGSASHSPAAAEESQLHACAGCSRCLLTPAPRQPPTRPQRAASPPCSGPALGSRHQLHHYARQPLSSPAGCVVWPCQTASAVQLSSSAAPAVARSCSFDIQTVSDSVQDSRSIPSRQ